MPRNSKEEEETIKVIASEIVAFFEKFSHFTDDKLDFNLHKQVDADPTYSLLQLTIDRKGRIAFKFCKRRSNIGHAAETHTGIENIYQLDARNEDGDETAWKFSSYPFLKTLWTDQ